MSTGRIVSWDREKGFGYLEAEGKRVFLHYRDFAERHKVPEVGDTVSFIFGTDQKGRPCAVRAVQNRLVAIDPFSPHARGRVSLASLLFLIALLVTPTLAGLGLTQGNDFWLWVGWWIVASGLTYWTYSSDKRRAQDKEWRMSEKSLHFWELIGGWPGAFVAQRRLRHKNSKLSYQFVFWLIVGAHQFAAVDYLRGWPWSRAAVDAINAASHEKKR